MGSQGPPPMQARSRMSRGAPIVILNSSDVCCWMELLCTICPSSRPAFLRHTSRVSSQPCLVQPQENEAET